MTTNNSILTDAQKWAKVIEVSSTWGLTEELQDLTIALMVKSLKENQDTTSIEDAVLQARDAAGAEFQANEDIRRANILFDLAQNAKEWACREVRDAREHLSSMAKETAEEEIAEALPVSDHLSNEEDLIADVKYR